MEEIQSVVVEKVESESWESEAEAIWKEYINHEASVKSIALLYGLGAVFGFLYGIGIMLAGRHNDNEVIPAIIVGSAVICLSIAQFIVAWGQQYLRSWARIPTVVLSSIGLLGFPIGTLVHAYILFLVLNKKAKMVFSDYYKAVIDITPHVKYKTSVVAWLILAAFVIFMVVLFCVSLRG